MTSLVLTLAFKESPLLHLEALQYPLSHRFTILHQWRLVTLLLCWSELARVVRNVDWDHNLQRYISNDEVGLSTVLSKRWSYGGLGERNATYIVTLLFEAKKNEVNICELGSLPIGVWVGCWWGLDECQCQDWVVPTISVSHVHIPGLLILLCLRFGPFCEDVGHYVRQRFHRSTVLRDDRSLVAGVFD